MKICLQEHYEYLPKVRQLSDNEANFVTELLEMRCPVKQIRQVVKKKFDKETLCKDLHNLRANGRQKTDDTVQAAAKLLMNTYGKYFNSRP